MAFDAAVVAALLEALYERRHPKNPVITLTVDLQPTKAELERMQSYLETTERRAYSFNLVRADGFQLTFYVHEKPLPQVITDGDGPEGK